MANSTAAHNKPRGDKAHQQKHASAKQAAAAGGAVEGAVKSQEPAKLNGHNHQQQQPNGNTKALINNKNTDQTIQNNSETKQPTDDNGGNNKKSQNNMNPIDIACDHESLNSIVRDLDVKIAILEKKMLGKPNKANDLKHSGRHSISDNYDNGANGTTSDDDDDEVPVAIVAPNKSDPTYQHLESLKKIRSNVMASIVTLEKQKKTALKVAQVDTMKRNVDDINKLKWLLTVQDTLKHLDDEARIRLVTASINFESQEIKGPLLTPEQLELIEKSIPFICPSRIEYESKFSVQLDTSSKFIMHLYEGKRKEAMPGINFKNLKDLLKKIVDAPYFSDRQRHQKTRNSSPEEVIISTSSENTINQGSTNDQADKPAEGIQINENEPCDEPLQEDNHIENNGESEVPEMLSVDREAESLQTDQANDNTQDGQPKNAARASHGYPPRKVYDNSRGRSSRGNGSRYNDRRRNYHQYDRKEFPQRGNDGAERPQYGNQKPRHQSSQRYKHSQKNMSHAEHIGTVPNGNGGDGMAMVYSNMQNDNHGLVHDPAVIAASVPHSNGGGIGSTMNVHNMQNTAHTVMYH